MEWEKPHKYVRRTRQSKASYLPPDLISEILLRLPVKSAVKSRCVSRLWSSITTLPSFISSFAARSSPRLLILSKKHDKLFVFSIPQNQNSDNKTQVVDSYVMTCPPRNGLFVSPQSVHGLICIKGLAEPHIWNPTTRDFSTLPTPERGWRDTKILLEYDPIDGIYKVLSITPDGRSQPRVLTLNGAHKSWRVIQEIPEHYFLYCNGQFINGVIYYGAYLIDNLADDYILVCFHVRSEKMSMIKVPWNDRSNTFILPYNGKLACVMSEANDITLWILEDAEKHVWLDKHLQLPFPLFDPVLRTSLSLRGVNDAGELIYVPLVLVNPFYIIYFDPNRNSYRTVEIEGVADDQFRHRNGLGGNVTLRTFDAFPNHIERLGQLSFICGGICKPNGLFN